MLQGSKKKRVSLVRGGGYVSGPTVPPGFPQVPANHVLHGTAVEDKSEREKKK